jgi:tRNA(fMet)-specific endonuclease VapC
MIYLPDTNACISLLRQNNPGLIARWQGVPARDIVLCSIVVYELRYGAERSSNPEREHAKLSLFLAPFASLPFDDVSAEKCAEIRKKIERVGQPIGPHDLQIAAIALRYDLTLITHNTREFSVIPGLKLIDWET